MAKATYKQIVYLGFWFQRIRVDGGESMAETGLTPAYLRASNKPEAEEHQGWWKAFNVSKYSSP